ncbi:hypothetical protein FA13DRAFT_1813653 [Coprinellus micaceus]|uniref:Uncharacterized protein n=1 Tax=Coprinellus micaceus TaxID=71717 RepID=A0A4Y7TCG6_COPMI|nr:hypothetical protein FA13DRAFT_1813653 [Coprinellus micaceus]
MTTKEELAYTYTEAGNAIARAMLAYVTIRLVAFGIQTFMCAYGLTVFLETPKPGRQGRLPYIIINFVFLVLSGVSSFADLRYFFIATFYSTSPEDFIIKRESQNGRLGFAAGVLCVLTSLVGDGLMLYRCCVVWCDRRLIWVLPALIYIASIVFSILFLHPMIEDVKAAWTNLTFGSLWTFSSVAMSILVTALIAFRLIQARIRLSSLGVADTTKTSSMYTGVLAILIESALPFTIIGIGYAIIMAVTQPYQDDVLKKEFANYVFFCPLLLFRGPFTADDHIPSNYWKVVDRESDLDNEGEDSQLSASDLEIVAGSSRDIQERELVEKT